MSPIYLGVFLITAGINAVAQLLLKRGSLDLGRIFAGDQNLIVRALKILANPFVFSAVVLLGSGMFLWIWLVSKVELSRAYPVNIALTIVITTALSIFLFSESFTLFKVAGISLIIAGLFLLLYS
ncbi:MAG: hypothetical protein HY435_03045 [Candidatus Liptonbacteria bacterium]|nr:hypothetical protein [Candidatus Liptonbacteria bacterium]